jgi:hypothetical protein
VSRSGDGKITALVPVYECADRLPAHLASVRTLRETLADFIWVVTPGRDESARLARHASKELGGQYLEVPPGLYQAWNAGIQAASTEFVYISTVGETVSPTGLDRLRQILQSQRADVCFTPPFLPTEARPRRQLLRWPIFRFQRELTKRQGEVLSPMLIAKIQAVAGIFSLLGSCASCLFRASYLKDHLFPSDYFHYGDSAWVYQNYRQARMVYLPDPIATFAVHGPSGRTVGPRDVERLRRIILRDFKKRPEAFLAFRALSRLCACSRYLDSRRGRRPRRLWWLKPRLLHVRVKRLIAEHRWTHAMNRPWTQAGAHGRANR